MVPIHPEQSHPPADHRGAFGLRWDAERVPNTTAAHGRWAAIGRDHGRLSAVIEVKFRPGHATALDVARLTAQLLNDIGEDAGNLMLAGLSDPKEQQ